MTHLESLIAKAKAYQMHCDPVDQNRIDRIEISDEELDELIPEDEP